MTTVTIPCVTAMSHDDLLARLTATIPQTCAIDASLFERYGVKRGLRNEDGSGVLVGLTKIGDVVGYDRDEAGRLRPIPGRLYYRGYDIDDLVHAALRENRFGFEEVAYLLLSGALPSVDELEQFRELLVAQMPLPRPAVMSILALQGTNVMNSLARSVLELYTHDENPEDLSPEHSMAQAILLIAGFPAIIAYSYNSMQHHTLGWPLHIRLPKPELSLAENFLYMLREHYTDLDAHILDLLLVLQAEHGGGNNSAFTVRVTSSTLTDVYSAIAAGVGSLKGPLHGGASLQVADMFTHLKQAVPDWKDEAGLRAYLEAMVRREAYDHSGLVYGVGHAVYTISDPRVGLLHDMARELADEKGRTAEFEFLELIGRVGSSVVSEMKMHGGPVALNVDFFTGFLYDLIGIPRELYMAIFAMSRIAGWVAHRIEEINFLGKRIIRPAYRNVLEDEPVPYVPLARR